MSRIESEPSDAPESQGYRGHQRTAETLCAGGGAGGWAALLGFPVMRLLSKALAFPETHDYTRGG